MLAGIGSGKMYFKISPAREIAKMIKNCLTYFISLLPDFCNSQQPSVLQRTRARFSEGSAARQNWCYQLLYTYVWFCQYEATGNFAMRRAWVSGCGALGFPDMMRRDFHTWWAWVSAFHIKMRSQGNLKWVYGLTVYLDLRKWE